MRICWIILGASVVAGCATELFPTSSPSSSTSTAPSKPAAPRVNLAGYSPAFRAGYGDGCGSVDAAKRRDEPRFKSDADYALGWRDGYDICRRRK
jgi:hypothetical protein